MALESSIQRDYILELVELLAELAEIPIKDSIINLEVAVNGWWWRLLVSILNITEADVISVIDRQRDKRT